MFHRAEVEPVDAEFDGSRRDMLLEDSPVGLLDPQAFGTFLESLVGQPEGGVTGIGRDEEGNRAIHLKSQVATSEQVALLGVEEWNQAVFPGGDPREFGGRFQLSEPLADSGEDGGGVMPFGGRLGTFASGQQGG